MNSTLHKIFRSKQTRGQFLFAGVGFLLGLLMLLLSTQLYIQVNRLFNPETNFPDFIIVSKKVSAANTFFMARAEFTPEQLEDLSKQTFVKQIGLFKANQFAAWSYGNEVIPIKTELFFESVPDEMLGEIPRKWGWEEGDDFVPVVMSQDFLNLYNFGYALAKGLPQISKSTVMLAPALRVKIYGPQGRIYVNMKIVGFNERIPSMLVPESFMDWANQNIGAAREENPARVIMQVTNPAAPDLLEYIEAEGLQVNKDKLQASKAGGMVKVAMTVIGIIGVFFVLLSLVIFTMNFKVVLAEAKDEIRLLLQLGYTTQMLGKYLITNFVKFISGVALLTSGLLALALWQVQTFFVESGLELEGGIEPAVIVVGLIFITVCVGINVWSMQRTLHRYG